MRTRSNSRKGFSLVEMITSIAIIAVISVLFITLFAGSLKISGNSVTNNQESARAQSAIEAFDADAAAASAAEGTVPLQLNFAGTVFKSNASAYQAGQKIYWVFRVK